jgi:Tfp pilus assembly protein PilF
VRAVVGNASRAAIQASIVDPARLPAARRDDVCFQCHMLPAVAAIGSRRLDRSDYSFRPGQVLDDYLLHVDTRERDSGGEKAPAERFEINHQAWRLTQSPCYQRGGITCIDCHDPHQPLARDPRLAGADQVCQRCHTPHALAASAQPGARTSCTGCHMPKRRTQDVVHVVMTDHRIQRPSDEDLLAPLSEREPRIADVQLLHPAAAGDAAQADLYRTLAIVGAGLGGEVGVAHLGARLAASAPADSPAWWDLAAAQLGQRQWDAALATSARLLAAHPEDVLARDWRGVARVGAGETTQGLDDLAAAAAAAPQSAEFAFNLGRVLHGRDRDAEALAPLSRALALRPNFVAAWIARAETHAALGQRDAAIDDYRQALAIDPRQTRAYQGLIPLLRAAGRSAEARRELEVGRRSAAQPEALRAL